MVSSTKTRWKFGPILIVLLVTACQVVTSLVPRQVDASMEIFALPGGLYPPRIAWLEDGIVMEYQPEAQGPINSALWWVEIVGDQGNLRKIDLPVQHDCYRQVFISPMRLPDGRLGYGETCIREVEPGIQTYTMAYNPETQEVEQLFEYGFRELAWGGAATLCGPRTCPGRLPATATGFT